MKTTVKICDWELFYIGFTDYTHGSPIEVQVDKMVDFMEYLLNGLVEPWDGELVSRFLVVDATILT